MLSATNAYLCSAISGLTLWAGTSALTGRREAWDAGVYWIVAYPAGIVIAGLLGYLSPRRAWRWGVTLMLVQPLTMAFSASDVGLLPLGLIVFAVLALPPAAIAALAAGLRNRGAHPLR
jgi:hypothetical protein